MEAKVDADAKWKCGCDENFREIFCQEAVHPIGPAVADAQCSPVSDFAQLRAIAHPAGVEMALVVSAGAREHGGWVVVAMPA
jgi:hypothetical protein